MNQRMVGCEDSDGLLHIHPDTETCEVCKPAVIPDDDEPDFEALAIIETDRRAWEGQV